MMDGGGREEPPVHYPLRRVVFVSYSTAFALHAKIK